jgi:hypothetical protein
MALPEKIIALWTVFLLGTLFHTQLALMPLFHHLSVIESHSHLPVTLVMWLMLIFFMAPMGLIVISVFNASKGLRTIHFGLTLIYTGLNALHFLLDALIAVPPYQLVLMAFLFLIGLLLNLLAYQWAGFRRTAIR